MSDVIVAPNTRDLDELANELARWMQGRLSDASDVRIDNLTYPRGAGQSHETILFDAHWNDPITMLGLSTQGYLTLANKVVALAKEHCNGKIVFVLEGGYDPVNVANGTETVFIAETGKGESEANDPNPHKEPDCESRIEEIRNWHGFA